MLAHAIGFKVNKIMRRFPIWRRLIAVERDAGDYTNSLIMSEKLLTSSDLRRPT